MATSIPFVLPRKTASTTTSSLTATAGTHLPVDASAGAVTVTLPTGKSEGAHLSIEKVDTSANTVTVTGSIRGTATLIPLTYQYETLELIAQASGTWRVVSNHLPKAAVDARIRSMAITARATAPSDAERAAGVVAYLDTSAVPPVLKGWDGSTWSPIGGAGSDIPDGALITDLGDYLVTDLGDYLISA